MAHELDLFNLQQIRALLGRHGFHFSKSLGQNFLTAPWVAEQIVERAGVDQTCGVLEVGPGMGALTRVLAGHAAHVTAVEIDRALLPVLDETLSGLTNVHVIGQDILETDLTGLAESEFAGLRRIVCANLPYYITTPILTHLIESRVFGEIIVMLQKEVALRLCAAPGSADYGAFTVFIGYHTVPELLFEVPPDCFVPAPKVTSAVVRLTLRAAPPAVPRDEELFFRTVRAAFAQRRKVLTNGLHAAFGGMLSKQDLQLAVSRAGFGEKVRGETLGIAEFVRLSDILSDMLSDAPQARDEIRDAHRNI